MATVNELLADDALSHAIDLSQYSNGVVRRMIALLNRVDADLADALQRALDRMPAGSFTVERLESMLGAVRRLNKDAFTRVEKELHGVLEEFVAYELDYQRKLFERVIPNAIQLRFRIASVLPDQVYAAALSRPFQGRLLKNWTLELTADRMKYMRNAVRLGFVEGRPVAEIVRGLIGTKAMRYQDGVINRSRRELTAVVHTAITHTAEVAREHFIEANAEVIASVFWQATLDTKTTAICRIRDGKEYSADKKHRPIGHTIPWLQGPGRSHWRCRSSARPRTKSWKELGFDLDELDAGTRASMDGQVAGDIDFGDWIEKQSATRQDEVVGPVRGKLMRDGKLPFDRLYSDDGRWLSIDQLRARDAAAFAQAGL